MTQQLRTSPDTSRHPRQAPAALTLVHGGRAEAVLPDPALERARAHALRDRHAEGLTRLLSERDDLRGVHALADLVDDAIRWSV